MGLSTFFVGLLPSYGSIGEDAALILTRVAGRVQAFRNICPHAGRRLDWAPGAFLIDQGRLVCAAHGASFDMASGLCVAGPCKGASLTAVALVSGIPLISDERRVGKDGVRTCISWW